MWGRIIELSSPLYHYLHNTPHSQKIRNKTTHTFLAIKEAGTIKLTKSIQLTLKLKKKSLEQ